MKPVITWVILANARTAKVLVHRRLGKGLVALKGSIWQAEEPDEPRDKAGVGHSIGGPGISAVDQGDPQLEADKRFAADISSRLSKAFVERKFNRLMISAGPHFLGLLRFALDDQLKSVTIGEVPKDLSAQSFEVIEMHLGQFIAV